jgi:hypothetical protein
MTIGAKIFPMITLSVFRLAARRTNITALIPLLEPAPVSENAQGYRALIGVHGR